MFTKRALAILVTLCMLATCFVAVGCTDAATDDTIYSDDTVTLDVTKTFEQNKKELAKLGITNPNGWKYDEKNRCNILTLDNVHFVTTASVGIEFTAPASVEYPTIGINLVGENTIVSGSEIASIRSLEDLYTKGIFATHLGTDGKEKEDFFVAFFGDGSIVVDSETRNDILGSAGIDVYGSLLVLENAKVYAYAGDVVHYTRGESAYTEEVDIYSVGVYVTHFVYTDSEDNGAILWGKGGNISVFFTDSLANSLYDLYSEGMSAESYSIKNSYVLGEGSEVYFAFTTTPISPPTGFTSNSVSAGLSARDSAIGTEIRMMTKITNSKVVGLSGWSKGIANSESVGLEFAASDKITIEDSILIGRADGAECLSVGNGNAYSKGIDFTGTTEITGSYIEGYSGNVAIGAGDGETLLYGLYCTSDLTFSDSVVNVAGFGMPGQTFSNGMAVYDNSTGTPVEKTITVNDSEIYARGAYSAIFAKEIKNSPGVKGCYSFDATGKHRIQVSDMLSDSVRATELLYDYDLIILNAAGNVVGFERHDRDRCVVGPYPGYIEDGLKFTGYEDMEGNDVRVGSTIELREGATVLKATFEEKEDSGSDTIWVVWVALIVALIAVAFVAGMYILKSKR